MARTAIKQGLSDIASKCYRRALRLGRMANDAKSQTESLCGLGRLACRERRWKKAERLYREAIAVHADFPSDSRLAWLHTRLGKILVRKRRWNEARDLLKVALRYFSDQDDARGLEQAGDAMVGLWLRTRDAEALAAIADLFGESPEQVEMALRRWLLDT